MSNTRFINLMTAAALMLGVTPCVAASRTPASETVPAADAGELDDLSLEETLKLPEVPQKAKEGVREYMLREAKALQKLGYKVETMRRGEVVIATIPAEKLFAPNDTALLPTAAKQLGNFLPYLRTPGKFKVILAMHSDDTGSEKYLMGLTEKRIIALYDYFDAYAPEAEALMGYPMGASEALAPNDSRANRSQNRRLEIYVMPDQGVISQFTRKSKK